MELRFIPRTITARVLYLLEFYISSLFRIIEIDFQKSKTHGLTHSPVLVSSKSPPRADDPCANRNQFTCHMGQRYRGEPKCVPLDAVCNGHADCPAGDDESDGPRTNCTIIRTCDRHNGGCSQVSGRWKGTFVYCLHFYFTTQSEYSLI